MQPNYGIVCKKPSQFQKKKFEKAPFFNEWQLFFLLYVVELVELYFEIIIYLLGGQHFIYQLGICNNSSLLEYFLEFGTTHTLQQLAAIKLEIEIVDVGLSLYFARLANNS